TESRRLAAVDDHVEAARISSVEDQPGLIRQGVVITGAQDLGEHDLARAVYDLDPAVDARLQDDPLGRVGGQSRLLRRGGALRRHRRYWNAVRVVCRGGRPGG